MVQFTVSKDAIHEIAWMTLAVVVLCHLLAQPPAPPERTAHQQPAPSRVPRGEEQQEGRENITPLPTAGFHAGAVPA